MPKFDSEIGGRSFQGQEMKEFEVPDESGYQELSRSRRQGGTSIAGAMDENSIREFQSRMNAQESPDVELEREIRAAREARKTGKERLNDGARRRIEMLIGMTRVTRSVDIGGNVYVLRTLKSKEMSDSMMAAAEYDGTIQSAYEARKQLLSRSLTQIAGVDFEQFIGSDKLEHKFLFIDELDDPLLTRLYAEYVILAQEAKDKYAIKTEEEVKEVIEDLKK